MPRNWLLSIAGLAGCSVDRRMEGMVWKKGGPAVRIAARMPGFRALRAQSGIWRAVSRSGGPEELALMNLWFVFALMTAAAVFAVLLPLGLGKGQRTGG